MLYVEQLLTTGGGWQDQVGGLVPGIKIGRFGTKPESTNIAVQQLSMPQDKLLDLQSRLLLVYTGRTRLAKNLLQVILNCMKQPHMSCLYVSLYVNVKT